MDAADETRPFAETFRATLARWCRDLEQLADNSGLFDLATITDESIDLTRAHPSGVAQLHAGHNTPLSNLIREPTSRAALRARARKLQADSQEYSLRYGLPSTQVAIATATWSEDGAVGAGRIVRTVPVLLRPVTLRTRNSADQEIVLALGPSVEVNPVLVATLRGLGADVNPDALAAECFAGAGFNPNNTLMRLRDIGQSVIADFQLAERLVVGCFVRPGQVLVEDVVQHTDALAAHPVIRALAGDEGARVRLRDVPIPPFEPADPAPWDERGVGDLEPSQHRIVQAVALGHSLFVEAAGSAPTAPTIAAIVSDAAASGRSVLYVPGHQHAGEAVFGALQAEGLQDLALDIQPTPGWAESAIARLVEAAGLTVAPPDAGALGASQSLLAERSAQLNAYVASLHEVREPWGVSAHEALQALARSSASQPLARTRIRLAPEACQGLTIERRAQAIAQLERLAELGEFDGAFDTPWQEVGVSTDSEAAGLLDAVDQVTARLGQVRAEIGEVCEASGVDEPTNVAGWGELLDVFNQVRETLDLFRPEFFERSAADMVDAFASPQWRRDHGVETSSGLRRQLKRQARDLMRPGSVVADPYEALSRAEATRVAWQRWNPSGPWPKVPANLAELTGQYEQLRAPLAHLEAAIGPDPDGTTLATMPLDQLAGRLDRLGETRADLQAMPERATLLAALHAAGLAPLVADLRSRPPADGNSYADPRNHGLIAAEIDLAWWLSVFEAILAADPFLASCNGRSLHQLLSDFAALDAQHVATLPVLVGASVSHWTRVALEDYPIEFNTLMAAAADRPVDLADVRRHCPHLAARLRPCWIVGALQLPRAVPGSVEQGPVADLVIIDAVQTTPLAQMIPAILRGAQVVVFGNQRRALAGGAAAELAGLLPHLELRASGGRRDPALSRFLIEFGGERLQPPWPLPHAEQLTRLETIAGSAMPDPTTGLVESTDEEIERVVALTLDHVAHRAEESLAVVAISRRHAARLRTALSAAAERNAALASALSEQRREPLTITDLTGLDGLSREAVILSVGFAKTPHGRLLHSFGVLDEPDGEPLLLGALAAVRHRLTVVSCFTADDLDPERLRGDGARLLGAVLEFAGQSHPVVPQSVDQPDELLADLARRLQRRGLRVEPAFGLATGELIPLAVGHPDLPDDLVVAVLTDDLAYLREPSNRVRVRLRRRELMLLGWQVHMAWSIAAFLDPEEQADAVEQLVRSALPAAALARSNVAARQAPQQAGHIDQHAAAQPAAQPTTQPGAQPTSQQSAPPAPHPAQQAAVRDAAPVLPSRGAGDEDASWGDRSGGQDDWLLAERPPHWQE